MAKILVFFLVDFSVEYRYFPAKMAWIFAAISSAYGFLVYERALVAIVFAPFGFVAAVVIGNLLERIGRFAIRTIVRPAIGP